MFNKNCLDCRMMYPKSMTVCPYCYQKKIADEAQRSAGHNMKFRKGAYYCISGCPLDPRATAYANRFAAAQHCLQEHGVKQPAEDEHYYQGFVAQKKWAARQLVSQSYNGHSGFKDPAYGVEDFLIDAGPNPPHEPPCHRKKHA